MQKALLALAALTWIARGWEDCDPSSITSFGPFSTKFGNTSHMGHEIYLEYPSGASPPSGSTGWPVVVFMHGMTLSWEYYNSHVQKWASQGFVVAIPFVKSSQKDDAVIPVTETDAQSIYAAYGLLQGIANGTLPRPQGLTGAIDANKLGLAGHSMGGEDTIRAAAGVRVPKGFTPLPKDALKVAIAQHPSLCTFPPPYPYTINKAEVNNASLNGALLLFTAENDRAFNVPVINSGTPKTEHTCWQAATGPSIFVNFAKKACENYPECKDMVGAPGCGPKRAFVGAGHMCACDAPGLDTWVSPELKWVTAALRLYLHHGNASTSACSALVWGDGPDSMRHDPNIAHIETHGSRGPTSSGASIVV